MGSAINARVAGFTFLIYIAAGIGSLVVWQNAGGGGDAAATLTAMTANPDMFRIAILLELLCSLCALTLAVTLFALTAAHGLSVALMAMACRFVEGFLIAASLSNDLGALWLAKRTSEEAGAVHLLAGYMMRNEVALTSTFFAIGSLLFACLFVRGRLIPAPLAWLGVLASIVLAVILPLQLVGFAKGPMLQVAWLPMLAFEVPLGLWLIFEGVRQPIARPGESAPASLQGFGQSSA